MCIACGRQCCVDISVDLKLIKIYTHFRIFSSCSLLVMCFRTSEYSSESFIHCFVQANEGRLYELITRHFLACLSADAQGAETMISLCVGKPSIPRNSSSLMSSEEGELFEAKGLVILQQNYLEVYPYDRWTERDIPDFRLGDWILPTNVEVGHMDQ